MRFTVGLLGHELFSVEVTTSDCIRLSDLETSEDDEDEAPVPAVARSFGFRGELS